jgi:hypothetical protein
VHIFETDLDRGGDVAITETAVNLDLSRSLAPRWAGGVSIAYTYEDTRFGDGALGLSQDPWGAIQRPSLGFGLTYAPDEQWRFGFAPTVQWAYESGAPTGDAIVAGAALSATRIFSPDLTLGLGVAAYSGLEQTRVIPFPIVDWRIDERWRLTNPFRTSPVGGAGLEIAYRINDAWSVGGGGTWRRERFRLDRDGPVPEGIGEWRGVPIFARATYSLSPTVRLEFYAGVIVDGKLELMDRHGDEIVEDDFDSAPLVGLTLQSRF